LTTSIAYYLKGESPHAENVATKSRKKSILLFSAAEISSFRHLYCSFCLNAAHRDIFRPVEISHKGRNCVR